MKKSLADHLDDRDPLARFWEAHAAWSQATFGHDLARGPQGPLKHLAKEVQECLAAPGDLEEYCDLLFLTFDACRRAGFTYEQLVGGCWAKLEKNRDRKWGPATGGGPVEHVREES